MSKPVNVAIVGLGFGRKFIPDLQRAPQCQHCTHLPAQCRQAEAGRRPFKIDKRFTRYRHVLKDPAVDFVHIQFADPRPCADVDRALQGRANMSCARCRSTTVEDCQQIVELVKKTGLKYMMAETVVYARQFLFPARAVSQGRAGQDPVRAASHQQDMDGWPNYLPGLPPMHYATHCVGPCLPLTRDEAEYVLLRLRAHPRRA